MIMYMVACLLFNICDCLFFLFVVKNQWSLVSVGGEGPCPRRRQCCCVIGDRVFLFGGTRYVFL